MSIKIQAKYVAIDGELKLQIVDIRALKQSQLPEGYDKMEPMCYLKDAMSMGPGDMGRYDKYQRHINYGGMSKKEALRLSRMLVIKNIVRQETKRGWFGTRTQHIYSNLTIAVGNIVTIDHFNAIVQLCRDAGKNLADLNRRNEEALSTAPAAERVVRI